MNWLPKALLLMRSGKRYTFRSKPSKKYLQMEHFVDHWHCPVGSSVEPYREYLEARWAQGPVMIKTLWLELQKLGFSGCYKSVWNFARD